MAASEGPDPFHKVPLPSVPTDIQLAVLPDPDLCLTPDKGLDNEQTTRAEKHKPKQVRFDVPTTSVPNIDEDVSILDIEGQQLESTIMSEIETVEILHDLSLSVIDDPDKENLSDNVQPTDENIVSGISEPKTFTAREVDNFLNQFPKKCPHGTFTGKPKKQAGSIVKNESVLRREGPHYVEEHVFQKPEFHTTLQVSRETKKLKQEVEPKEVGEKVNRKLKKQSRKVKIEEKVVSRVNPEQELLFRSLEDIEIPLEDAIQARERERRQKAQFAASKTEAITKTKLEPKIREPDIQDFFTSDLQVEGASLTLDRLPDFSPGLRGASEKSAFTVYKHIRCWEGL